MCRASCAVAVVLNAYELLLHAAHRPCRQNTNIVVQLQYNDWNLSFNIQPGYLSYPCSYRGKWHDCLVLTYFLTWDVDAQVA